MAVRWTGDGLGVVILDQTRLPERHQERELRSLEGLEEAIRRLRVRGAPLIGITAAMGVAALARALARSGADEEDLRDAVSRWCRRLEKTRPTAVNLTWALRRMERAAAAMATRGPRALAERLADEADAILEEDRLTCRRIGEHALELIRGRERILTHCNTGALATGGIGTALAPLYLARRRGWPVKVWVGETRPLLQGSRLTAWELGRAGIDVTVMADGMAGTLFARQTPHAVLVGADRIAANGDVANKVGTYGLAVLAHHHRVPFYVLAPTSTLDAETPTGADIPIEFRDADEIRRGFGGLTAPPESGIWSPAFDVTPAPLVTAIVTERGVARPPYPGSLGRALREADAERARSGSPGFDGETS